MDVLLLALVAGAGFVAATLAAQTGLGTSRSLHHVSVVVAAGILLGVAFADLVPEAFELLDATAAALAIAGGFLALYMVETLTRGHTHHHEVHAPGHDHSHGADPDCVGQHAIAPFLVGLGLHNLADGLVLAASGEVSGETAVGLATGILVHQLPVGLSFAAVLVASGASVASLRRAALGIGLLIPAGALVVLLAPMLAAQSLGVVVATAAGALVYIATGHLLPEAHSEERRPLLAVAFTVALVGTILALGAMHDEHDDAHDEDDAGHVDAG